MPRPLLVCNNFLHYLILSFFLIFPLPSLSPPKDLHGYLKQHSLSEYEVTRYQLVQVLLKLTRTELSSNTQLKIDQIGSIVQSGEVPMWACAWACLDALCQPLHGPADRTVLEVRDNSTLSVSLISKSLALRQGLLWEGSDGERTNVYIELHVP